MPSLRHCLEVVLICYNIYDVTYGVTTIPLTWSQRSYGPDGPWQAVQTWIGSNLQPVDLVPGAIWWTNVLSSNFCSNKNVTENTCYAKQSGLYNPKQSSTAENPHNGPSYPSMYENLKENGRSYSWVDTVSLTSDGVTNVTQCAMLLIDSAYGEYHNGNHTISVGQLSLGSPSQGQPVSRKNGDTIDSGTPPNAFYVGGLTASPSFGMHIGSARAGIAGSLYFGGYDKSRALGNVISNPYAKSTSAIFQISLRQIGLTTIDRLTNPSMLRQGNSSIGEYLAVGIAPWNPYMYLPPSVCDAMTRQLPIKFDSELGYYLWKTNDPTYRKLINSSSYYTFNFVAEKGSKGNTLDIRMPLKLLDLTLEQPIVKKPTKYFPCIPWSTDSRYRLGMSFLQAAFFGVNWQEAVDGDLSGDFFLAQAPGPNTLASGLPTQIQETQRVLGGWDASWEKTWKGHWDPLEFTSKSSSGSQGNNNTGKKTDRHSGQSQGLSTGAQAGIGVGVAVGVILVASITAYVVFRNRRRKRGAANPQVFDGKTLTGTPASETPSPSKGPVQGFYTPNPPQEKEAGPTHVPELPGSQKPLPELPSRSSRPAELE